MSGNNTGTVVNLNAVLQFSGATGAVWNNLTVPLPNGLVTIETDTGIMKRGDGVTLYANLPIFFNLSTLTTLMTNVVTKSAGNAQTGDLVATTKLFGLNAAGSVVMYTPAQLFSWLINSQVLKVVGGNVEQGP